MQSLFRMMMQKLRRGWRRSRSRSASVSSSSTDDVREPSSTSRASQGSHKSRSSRKSTGSQSTRSRRNPKANASKNHESARTLHSTLSAQCSADTLSTTSSSQGASSSAVGPAYSLAPSCTFSPCHRTMSVSATPTHQQSNSSITLEPDQESNGSSSHQSSLADCVPELPLLSISANPLLQSNSASYMVGARLIGATAADCCADTGCPSDEQSLSLPNLSPSAPPSTQLTSSPTSPSLLTQEGARRVEQLNAGIGSTSMDSDELQSNSADEDSQEISSDAESVISAEITIDLTKGYRSKSLDASVVLAMARAGNLGSGKPRSSAPFLEIPKWRLFIRKPSTDQTGSGPDRSLLRVQIQLSDIFRDCVHCKCLMDLQRLHPQSAAALDAFCAVGIEPTDRNNNELQRIREQSSGTVVAQPPTIVAAEPQTTGLPSAATSTDLETSATESSVFEGVGTDPSGNTRLFRRTKTPVRNNRYSRAIASHTVDTSPAGALNVSSVNATAIAPISMSAELNKCAEPSPPPTTATEMPGSPFEQSQSAHSTPSINTNVLARRLPSVTLSEVSDDDPAPLSMALGDLLQATTDCFGAGHPNSPCVGIQVTDLSSFHGNHEELDDPGSGITVISLEVPLLSPGSGKQARSASVDSSFLQVPPRPDIGSCELPPTKSIRSRSVDIALPEGPDGPYLVVPNANQRPITTK
jgi:hypothetical protein